MNSCDDCSTETPAATRPCAGCGVDVYLCGPCEAALVLELQKPYVCAFCRNVQRRTNAAPSDEPTFDVDEDPDVAEDDPTLAEELAEELAAADEDAQEVGE